jgi:hypothetical protein
VTMRMTVGLGARIIQVVRDFLPAELNLVDSDNGGLATPDIPNANMFEWNRPLINAFPALVLAFSSPQIIEMRGLLMGDRLHAIYPVDVRVHVLGEGPDDAHRLQELSFRYVLALTRILTDQKHGLETALDPVRYVHLVRLRGVFFGPDVNQDEGQITRTSAVMLDVERIEQR